MRKRIIDPRDDKAAEYDWVDLEPLAQVEITSEAVGYSIEAGCASLSCSKALNLWQVEQAGLIIRRYEK